MFIATQISWCGYVEAPFLGCFNSSAHEYQLELLIMCFLSSFCASRSNIWRLHWDNFKAIPTILVDTVLLENSRFKSCYIENKAATTPKIHFLWLKMVQNFIFQYHFHCVRIHSFCFQHCVCTDVSVHFAIIKLNN